LKKRFMTFAAVAFLAISAMALAACGSDDDSSTTAAETTTSATETSTSAAGGATVSFAADQSQLAYTETDVSAKAGDDTIEFDNPSTTGHDVVIEDQSGKEIARTDVITDSTTSTTADLKAGTYTFYCSVPGHREAGMEGTLNVK